METTYCSKCGTKNSKDASFCGSCGEKISLVAIEKNNCPGCGYVSNEDEKYCPECGTALTLGNNEEKTPNSQLKPARKKKSRQVVKTTSTPPVKNKKGGILRTLGKVALWFFALLIVVTTILYFVGDESDTLTGEDQDFTKESFPNVSEEEMKLPPIKVRQAHPKLSNTQSFKLLANSKQQEISFFDKIKVSTPPNFTSKEKSLSISYVEIDETTMVEGAIPLSLIDLTLNEGEQPAKPVEVAFKFNPKELKPFTARERLEAFRWDKEGGGWVKLPIRIDEKENIAYAKVDHFSIIGFVVIRTLVYGGAYVSTVVTEKLLNNTYYTPDKNFKILYSKKAILADQDLNTKSWKAAPTGRDSRNKSNAPPYVQSVGYILEEALKSYTDKDKYNFKNPAGKEMGYFGTYQKTITVKLDSWFTSTLAKGEPSYEKIYERIHVPTNGAFQYWSAKRVFAHELFHRVQAEYYGKLGMLRGSTTKVYTGANCWWLESTADYAAYHMAFNPSLGGMEKGLGNDYLEYPINKTGIIPKTDDNFGWTSREYEYITSIWVKYLVDIRKLNLEKMIAADASDHWKPEYSLGRYMYKTYKKSSSDFYRDFTHWMMFSPKGGLNKYAYTTQVNKDDRDIALENSTLLLGKKGELSYTFNMPEHFTSQLWAINLDKPASNSPVKKSPVIIDVKEKAIGSVIDVFLLPKGKSFIDPPMPIKTFYTGKQSKIIMVEEGQVLCIVATQGSIPGGNTEVLIRDASIQLDISPSKILDAESNKLYSFEIKATEIPKEIQKVKFEWDYSDGTKKSISNIEVISESAEIEIEHEYESSDKEVSYPLKVILKDNNTGITLAAAEANIILPIEGPKVFITERHLVGPPEATFDMEALASPDNIYKFVWEIDGIGKSYTHEGKKSSIAPIIDKIGKYKATVKLYDLDGTYLSRDAVTITVEADDITNNITRIFIGFDFDNYSGKINGNFNNENYKDETIRNDETISKKGSKIIAKTTRYYQPDSKPHAIYDLSIDGIDNANNLISISYKAGRNYSSEIREQTIRLVDVPFTKKVSDIPKSFVGGNKLFVEYRFEGDLKNYIREVKDRTERLDDGEVYNANLGTKCSIYLSLTLK